MVSFAKTQQDEKSKAEAKQNQTVSFDFKKDDSTEFDKEND